MEDGPESTITESASNIWQGFQKLCGGRALLLLAVVAQVATILITWKVWQARTAPPNMPVFELPQVSFEWLVLGSAFLPLVIRRAGVWLHLAVLVVACCFDQFRLQPQFLFCWLFMWATVSDEGKAFCRWALPAMWLWAGLHKLISPEWFGCRPWAFLSHPDTGLEEYYLPFAIVVAVSELVQGVLAIWKPWPAAFGCVLVHVGVVVCLMVTQWNYSVIPWNLATAVIGFWILISWDQSRQTTGREKLYVAVLFASPILYFFGWLDHGFSNVLYSGMVPDGLISYHDPDGDPLRPATQRITGWGELNIPFPNERRLLRQHFGLVAPDGSKLHVSDPRLALNDQYFIKRGKIVEPISRHEFFSRTPGSVMGIGYDYQQANFVLQTAEVRLLQRSAGENIYAIEFDPDNFDRSWLRLLAGFPNLEQIQFADCDLRDEDLKHLVTLLRLEGLGLSNTQVTDRGLQLLKQLPNLRVVEATGTGITDAALTEFLTR